MPKIVWLSTNPKLRISQSSAVNPQNDKSKWTRALFALRALLNSVIVSPKALLNPIVPFCMWIEPSELKLRSITLMPVFSVTPLDSSLNPSLLIMFQFKNNDCRDQLLYIISETAFIQLSLILFLLRFKLLSEESPMSALHRYWTDLPFSPIWFPSRLSSTNAFLKFS